MFDEPTLMIGFAQGFTAYRQPDLIFAAPDRLSRILNAHGQPVRLVFAGIANPADEAGKYHLQHIYRPALDPKFGGRIAFIDDYDLHLIWHTTMM